MDLCSSIVSWYKLQLALKGHANGEAYADGHSHMQSFDDVLPLFCEASWGWSFKAELLSYYLFLLKAWELFLGTSSVCKWFWLYLLILEYVNILNL